MHQHALCINPAIACDKSDILSLIEKLGFVQVDSIKTVERAHHLILFSRHQTYKHTMLEELLEKDRSLFENWTHDASIIPAKFYPYWKHRFEREKTQIKARWENWGRSGFTQISDEVMDHITKNGPTFSRDLKPKHSATNTKPGWWDWHPQKTSLEYLWRTGKTAISYRLNFQKAYDLCANVIPPEYFKDEVSQEQFIDWACYSALERLGFATPGEIVAFWALISPAQCKAWVEKNNSKLIAVEIQSFDKKTTKHVWALHEIVELQKNIPPPPARLRILSPFDPMLRDRKRAEFLFGFNYRIEVFVPQEKRQYGYYVFPILERDKLIGRIDMKADRKNDILFIRKIWLEPKTKWSKARKSALKSELKRIARFTSLNTVKFDSGAFINNT